MSEQENKPETQEKKPVKKAEKVDEQKNGGNGAKIAAIVLAIFLLAALGGVFYLNQELDKLRLENKDQSTTIVEQSDEIDIHLKELSELNSEYDRLMIESDSLQLQNGDLKAKQAELQALIKKYKGMASASDAEKEKFKKQLKTEIAKFTLELAKKDEEISYYKTLTESQMKEIDSMAVVSGQMTDQITSLAGKVALASVLKVKDVSVVVLSKKDKELKSKEIYKAKLINKVLVKYTIASNEVSPIEQKTIRFKLTDPSGTVLMDLDNGGGSFHKADGSNDLFTALGTIDFQNKNETGQFTYEFKEELTPGIYKISLFESGYVIGSEELVIK